MPVYIWCYFICNNECNFKCCPQVLPLSTFHPAKQRRLRHLRSIAARNIVNKNGSPLLDTYFTLHLCIGECISRGQCEQHIHTHTHTHTHTLSLLYVTVDNGKYSLACYQQSQNFYYTYDMLYIIFHWTVLHLIMDIATTHSASWGSYDQYENPNCLNCPNAVFDEWFSLYLSSRQIHTKI